MPTVEVRVILYKSTDTNGNAKYALDIDPLTALASPVGTDGKTPVNVVWKLETRPLGAVLPNAELIASFSEGKTPFNASGSGTETYTTNAGSFSDNNYHGASSGLVRNDAVGGAGDDPDDEHTRLYKYTVRVNIKDEDNKIIDSCELDPSVFVRRRGVKGTKDW